MLFLCYAETDSDACLASAISMLLVALPELMRMLPDIAACDAASRAAESSTQPVDRQLIGQIICTMQEDFRQRGFALNSLTPFPVRCAALTRQDHQRKLEDVLQQRGIHAKFATTCYKDFSRKFLIRSVLAAPVAETRCLDFRRRSLAVCIAAAHTLSSSSPCTIRRDAVMRKSTSRRHEG